MKKGTAIFSSAVALSSSLALAQEPTAEQADESTLEEVLVFGTLSNFSALKSDTPIMESARSVSIITQQQILERGALVLDDTFTYNAGVTGEAYGFATRGDWVFVRGLDVPQYQDSLQSLFGNYNNTRPHIYTLEQVEILKGPASVLYGQGSPGGIVNVVSKRPQSESAHEITAEYGTFDHTQLGVDSTGAINDQWSYRFVGVYKDSDSQVDEVFDKTTVIAPSISWRPGDATDITLLLNYTETESDTAAQFLPVVGTLEPAANGQYIDHSTYLGDPDFNKYDAETLAITLLASHQFNETWSMEFTSRYTDASADYQQAWPSFIGGDRYVYNTDGSLFEDGTVPRSFYRSDASSEQAAVDVRFRAQFDTGSIEHSVLMGGQYQDITTTDAGYYDYANGYWFIPGDLHPEENTEYWINVFDPVYGNYPDRDYLDSLYTKAPDVTVEDLGFYIHDHMTLANWHLTVGVRWDETENEAGDISQDDDATSASVGLLYQFENGLAPYVSWAESFDPVIGDNGAGRPLQPREGEQIEAGLKYQPQKFPALITLAWFEIDQTNLNDPLALPGEVEQQSGEASVDGIELEAQARLGDFRIQGAWSKMDTESADGYRFPSVPEDQASAWVTWQPSGNMEGFRAGAGVRYVGATWDGYDQFKTPSYTLGDLMLGYAWQNWDFSVNVRNLEDKEYLATCLARGDCFPGEERTIVGRVSYRIE
ncbi:TonB-dependent siderophore receptor [Halioglobus maricola]|uniref:TonB-dependent siderophore receptor n=1 Tax=Halioglobus maricola TaxID=2601894 RepID=A0A5P9NNJ9_9GAMM|nr:TonB-dependent siderophore receptor [Halioglobus maricola]QFU77352.1 TonB-dependent siderophore receptor [Halioglobus maricola]